MHEYTPFEQAFFAYREAIHSMSCVERDIAQYKEHVAKEEQRLAGFVKERDEARAKLRMYLTPEAFEQLMAVTP